MADGFGTKRYYVMYNDFLLIGPASDPANAKGSRRGGRHEEDRPVRGGLRFPRRRQRHPRQGAGALEGHKINLALAKT